MLPEGPHHGHRGSTTQAFSPAAAVAAAVGSCSPTGVAKAFFEPPAMLNVLRAPPHALPSVLAAVVAGWGVQNQPEDQIDLQRSAVSHWFRGEERPLKRVDDGPANRRRCAQRHHTTLRPVGQESSRGGT